LDEIEGRRDTDIMKTENDWLITQLDTLIKMQQQLEKLTAHVEEMMAIVKTKIKPEPIKFNVYERTLVLHLQEAPYPESIAKISNECNMGWSTAKKYLNKLVEKGRVMKVYGKYKLNE